MPRYHYKCRKCQRDTVILTYEGQDQIDSSFVNCAWCGASVTLNGYFETDDARIQALAEIIEDLRERVEKFEDVESVTVLHKLKDVLN